MAARNLSGSMSPARHPFLHTRDGLNVRKVRSGYVVSG